VADVDTAIQQLVDSINSFEGTRYDVEALKGFIGEAWHADTFNINAVLRDTTSRATRDGSNAHASVDVSTNFGATYSLKYYATGADSAKSQAKNVIQAYYEYRAKPRQGEPLSFEKYLEKYGYTDTEEELYRSVYYGQGRIIPSDQLKDAIRYLEKKIAQEGSRDGPNRAALLEGYRETLQKLSDRISDNQGTESIPLTKDEARAIAELAKEGDFHAEDFGIGLDMITQDYIIQQALKAGYTSAVISLVLQLAPEIFKAIDYLIKNGEVDLEMLKEMGVKALSASATGFLRGSISCSLTIACRAGKLGKALVDVNPSAIAAVTVILIDTAINGFRVATGKMTAREMGTALTKELIISSAALAGGVIGQAIIPSLPVLGYMLGSFLGSVVAGIAVEITGHFVISFCVDTGFTCFGLVKQDYVIPASVLRDYGVLLKEMQQKSVKTKAVHSKTLKTKSVTEKKLRTIDITVLRRGVLGVNLVGYLA